MNLTINRIWYTENSTCGEMLIDGEHFCYTLEPRADQSFGKPYCIPAGTYEVLLQYSPRFKRLTPHLQNVPGFTAVEIHMGNYPHNTEGCTLVGGTHPEPDFVGYSDSTFVTLMKRLQDVPVEQGERITATYVDHAEEKSNGRASLPFST